MSDMLVSPEFAQAATILLAFVTAQSVIRAWKEVNLRRCDISSQLARMELEHSLQILEQELKLEAMESESNVKEQ